MNGPILANTLKPTVFKGLKSLNFRYFKHLELSDPISFATINFFSDWRILKVRRQSAKPVKNSSKKPADLHRSRNGGNSAPLASTFDSVKSGGAEWITTRKFPLRKSRRSDFTTRPTRSVCRCQTF